MIVKSYKKVVQSKVELCLFIFYFLQAYKRTMYL
jgi:hypothetical protein